MKFINLINFLFLTQISQILNKSFLGADNDYWVHNLIFKNKYIDLLDLNAFHAYFSIVDDSIFQIKFNFQTKIQNKYSIEQSNHIEMLKSSLEHRFTKESKKEFKQRKHYVENFMKTIRKKRFYYENLYEGDMEYEYIYLYGWEYRFAPLIFNYLVSNIAGKGITKIAGDHEFKFVINIKEIDDTNLKYCYMVYDRIYGGSNEMYCKFENIIYDYSLEFWIYVGEEGQKSQDESKIKSFVENAGLERDDYYFNRKDNSDNDYSNEEHSNGEYFSSNVEYEFDTLELGSNDGLYMKYLKWIEDEEMEYMNESSIIDKDEAN